MSRPKPYQPLLLRLLHGIHAVLALAAAITGFWMYNTWDRRFGQLPLPKEDPYSYFVHLGFGNDLYLILPVFAVYSSWAGRRRLVQPDSLHQLKQVGQPIWWYTLHRLVNTGLLLIITVALISGRLTIHQGLLNGILSDPWYNVHIVAWLVLVLLFATHLLMIVKVGGVPLLLSIVDLKLRRYNKRQ